MAYAAQTIRGAVPAWVAIAILAGCSSVSTVDSPFDPDTAVEDDRLLGDWSSDEDPDAEGDCCFTLVREGSVYRVLPQEEDEGSYMGRLFEVGSELFLDVWPDVEDSGGQDLPGTFEQTIPLHQLMRLEFLGDSATADFLDGDVIEDRIESGALGLDYLEARGQLVLTGSTGILEPVMTELATDDEAWEGSLILYRR